MAFNITIELYNCYFFSWNTENYFIRWINLCRFKNIQSFGLGQKQQQQQQQQQQQLLLSKSIWPDGRKYYNTRLWFVSELPKMVLTCHYYITYTKGSMFNSSYYSWACSSAVFVWKRGIWVIVLKRKCLCIKYSNVLVYFVILLTHFTDCEALHSLWMLQPKYKLSSKLDLKDYGLVGQRTVPH